MEDSALSFNREVEVGSEVRVGAPSLNLGPGEWGALLTGSVELHAWKVSLEPSLLAGVPATSPAAQAGSFGAIYIHSIKSFDLSDPL